MRQAIQAMAMALALLPGPAGAAAPKLKAEEVIQRHLATLGPAAGRAALVRHLKGPCHLISPSGGQAGALAGSFALQSDPSGFQLTMEFLSPAYPGESFALEGREARVGFPQPGRRSALGNFLSTNEIILRESLLGGALNAGWPLAALAERGAKVDYDGLKRFAGRECHRLRYRAKKGQGDLEVFLYLEPDTFRHVASVYQASHAQAIGVDITQSSQESDVYLRLEETFASFRDLGGVSIPTEWTLRYQTQARVTEHWKYELRVE